MVTANQTDILDPQTCLRILENFWSEQSFAEQTRDGIALTLPLMFPDGWQLSVFLEQLAPSVVRISDHGKTLGGLVEAGLTLSAKITGELLAERLRTFEVYREGFVLSKEVRLPLQGIDIQLFAEALVSISHLIYRHEPSGPLETFADDAVRSLLRRRNIIPRRNAELQGRLEQRIKVDYLIDQPRPLAIEVVSRRYDILPYMEQWAFRWDDLRKQNHSLRAAMVYDPERQEWDSTALRIGTDVCDIFCRYDEAGPLDSALGGDVSSPRKETVMPDKRIYVEQRPEGDWAVRRAGSDRASDVLPTQEKAIERARELEPGSTPHVERVRHTDKGGPDKWRSP